MSSPAVPKKIWTILDLITWGTKYLDERNIDDARLTIELLLAHVLHLKRIQLYTSFDQPLADEELARFKGLLKRILANEPLQYVLGEAEFMGLKFAVDRRVLIPRPETELLVETSIKMMKERYSTETELTILDIGTGSGCIAVSIAKMVPNANIVAIDLSGDALSLAKQNAEQHGVAERIQFLQIDIMALNRTTISQHFHCVLSNPPYISKKEFAEVSKGIREFEPNSALTDNENGLKFYPAIANFSRDALLEGGVVGVEHAFDQSESVQAIFAERGFLHPTVVQDYQGIKRHLFFSHTTRS